MNSIQRKLDTERDELLDLSLRNPLINYRLFKARGVEVVDESPPNVYRILVQEGKAMSFLPKPEPDEDENLQLFEEDEMEKDSVQHIDNKLQTDYSPAELQSRLRKTHDIAKIAIGEQGVNTLYLALGMLQWYESESSDILRRAPLILIPVEIDRTSVRARFRIRYTGEDIGTNLSLQERLKSDFDIQLPSIPEVEDLEGFNVQSYYQTVVASIVDVSIDETNRWSVNDSAIALGFFSFTKFLMYHDLDAAKWGDEALLQHPVLQSLLETGFQEPKSTIPDDAQIDDYLNPIETHHVVDADSSQALAIHDVSQGRNLVIQGPPGTGKSQTITNLIAEAIAGGKRVLFVSEKMAALEVVKRNLDKVELGDACLELHSHKMNKKTVVGELKRTFNLGQQQRALLGREVELLINNRDRLNRYCIAVNTPIGESGITPYQAYGELLRVERRLAGVQLPTLDLHQFQHSLPDSLPVFRKGEEITEEFRALLRRMGTPIKHPFWGSRCRVFLRIDRESLERIAAEAKETVIALKGSAEQLAQYLKLPVPNTCEVVENLIRAARRALDAPNLVGVNVQSTEWRTRRNNLEAGLNAGEQLNRLYNKYENYLDEHRGNLIDDMWLTPVREIRPALERLKRSSVQLAQHLKIQPPDSLVVVEDIIRMSRRALHAPSLAGVNVRSTEWRTYRNDLEVGLSAGERLNKLHSIYDHILIPDAWRQSVLPIRQVLAAYRDKWWRILSGKYWRARNELAGLCKQPLPKDQEACLCIVDAILEAQHEMSHLEKIRVCGQRLFGTHWQGESSDWSQLQEIVEYLSALHESVANGDLPEALIAYLAANPDFETLQTLVTAVETNTSQYLFAVSSFEPEIQLPESLTIQFRVVNKMLEVSQITKTIVDGNPAEIQQVGQRLFGTHWQRYTSIWSQRKIIVLYLLALHDSVANSELPRELIHYFTSDPDFTSVQSIISRLNARHRIIDGTIKIKQTVDAIIQMRQVLENFRELGQRLFGTNWQGECSNWSQLQEIVEYLSALHESVANSELPDALIAYHAANPDFETLETLVLTVEEHRNGYSRILQVVTEKIQLDETVRFGSDNRLKTCPFTEQAHIFECWGRESAKLQDIVTYNHLVEALRNSGFAEIVTIANDWPEANQFLSDLLKRAWYRARIERAMQERPILASFDGNVHQTIGKRFKKLDRDSLECNKAQVAYEHWRHLPKNESSSGQLGVLMSEFGRPGRKKKRRPRSIRALMTEAGNIIQTIKPIFMMSPFSVAKFLPLESIRFDWVVFDEASQVKPVDAYGAIIRGAQTIVVGDSDQLPPTDFFDKYAEADDEEVEENLIDSMESILESFCAKRAPQRRLRWHYRSQHESLITVSNIEFYDNELQLFPSPDAMKEEVGLIYHHYPDTVYDRGGSRTNREEARIVAEKVMEHARSHPDLTLGVATFSAPQMTAIQDQLEILRGEDPSCEETFFNKHPEEPFFVKNLENVQGDERDVIFISIGYGRDANGHLTMNFGPLSQNGGERRLNVLITRARQRCKVFSNLTADDIDLNRTDARGVQVLRRYLKYAETDELDISKPSSREADSPFEEEVANALRELGYQVDHQIGSAGYFIDLGVKDPERPGRYLLGIECDGATYHSAQSARDRDRLRQQVLEGVGWHIHRVWSTDWFGNPDRELRRATEEIERARVHGPPSKFPSGNNSPDSDEGEEVPESKTDIPEPPKELPKYKLAEPIISTNGLDLYTVSPFVMANWIQGIVKIESPVHIDEIARRIVTAVGVSQIGNRIRKKVKTAARQAAQSGSVHIREGFLYWTKQEDITVRDRRGLPGTSRKLELIAPEEIEVAIKQVVSAAFGIDRDELARETCWLFGFKPASAKMRQEVNRVVEGLIEEGQLIWQGDSLVIP